jgi:hypothetical protein
MGAAERSRQSAGDNNSTTDLKVSRNAGLAAESGHYREPHI